MEQADPTCRVDTFDDRLHAGNPAVRILPEGAALLMQATGRRSINVTSRLPAIEPAGRVQRALMAAP